MKQELFPTALCHLPGADTDNIIAFLTECYDQADVFKVDDTGLVTAFLEKEQQAQLGIFL